MLRMDFFCYGRGCFYLGRGYLPWQEKNDQLLQIPQLGPLSFPTINQKLNVTTNKPMVVTLNTSLWTFTPTTRRIICTFITITIITLFRSYWWNSGPRRTVTMATTWFHRVSLVTTICISAPTATVAINAHRSRSNRFASLQKKFFNFFFVPVGVTWKQDEDRLFLYLYNLISSK